MASALSKDEKGEGDILFLYRQHHLRQKPFLRRNLRKALHQLHATTKRALMGSFLSRPKQSRAREPSDNDDEDLSRPSKRRKTSQHNDHEGDVHLPTHPPLGNGEPGASVLGGAGDDHRFEIPLRTAPTFGQAAPKVKQDLFELESILPKVPEYTLRIDVLGISHDNENAVDLSRVKNGQNIKCGVMLAIFTTENENSSEYFEVHRAAQVGSMMTTIENGKPGAKISIPKPFFVKAEELYVNKGDENWLSDSYKLLFWVKPVGPQANWPPLDTATSVKSSNLAGILEKENATLKQLWMFCSTSFLLDPQRQTDPLNISLIYGVQTKASSKAATSYMLDLDINWSLPGSLSTFASRPSEVQPAAGSKSDNLLEPANGSPRRVQRRRNEATNYNLKVLSDRARGDLPKVPKLKETRSALGAAEQGNNVSVIYTVGRADAEDFGIKQKTTVSGFTCVICCKDHRSLEKLRQHFKSEHRQFIFHLRGSQQPRIKFCVSLSDRISSLEPSRIIQLGRPKTLFDLGRFLEGDMSWEKARRGPQHNLWPEHLADQFQASPSSSPAVSRHSSPNTSLGASEENLDSLEPKASVQFTRPKKLRVPKTAQTLYHPVTKRPLIPGEEIDNSDDESDEGWLNQKHRDIIMNYTDVTDSEKDYIIRWNPFITSLKLSSDIYMPQIIKRFVSENKLWFLTDNNRIKEFCKHTEALMLRGTIDFDCFAQCMEMLKEADKNTSEHNIRKAQISEIPTWDKTRHRGFMDCICCLPVDSIGPLNRVVCNGPNCISPYFHPRCVQEAIIDAQGFLKNLHELKTWKCGACRDDQRVIIRVAGSFFN